MKRTIILATTLPLFLLALSVSSAEAGRFGKHSARERSANHLERIAERLELSEEQVAEIKSIHEETGKNKSAFRKNLRRLRHQLAGVMLEDEPDAGKARELTKKIGAIQTSIQVNMIETRLAIRGLLTDDQRDRFLDGFPGFGGGHCSQSGFSRRGDSFRDNDYNAGGGRHHRTGKGHRGGGSYDHGAHQQKSPVQ